MRLVRHERPIIPQDRCTHPIHQVVPDAYHDWFCYDCFTRWGGRDTDERIWHGLVPPERVWRKPVGTGWPA